MADINYPQRWLSEHKANRSKIGWYRPETFEMLKCQKGLDSETINVTTVFMIIPDTVDCQDVIPLQIKFLPRIATELEYDFTISDTTICNLNATTGNLEFLGKTGTVTFTVTMQNGGAIFTKDVQVTKEANAVRIKEGNTFIQGIEKNATFELLPEDTTEEILNVSVWNNNHITISSAGDAVNVYKIKCDVLGTFDLKVESNRKTYKLPILSIDDESKLVQSISLDYKPFYLFNETIFLQPTFLPDTATLKDYNVYVNDLSIAKYISGKNAIVTNEKNGVTKVTIEMINGTAKFEYDLKVQDTGTIIPPDDIDIINIPTTIKEKETMKLDVKLSPDNATVDDLAITSTQEASIKFENGKWYITGEKTGEATITLKSPSNNIEKTYKIQVTPIMVTRIEFSPIPNNIVAGESHNFNVVVLPTNATNRSFDITTSDNLELADMTIEGLPSYKVTAKTEGAGWIKAVAKDGSGIEHIKNLTVDTAPVLVDYIELELPDEVHKSAFFDISSMILIEPQEANDKTYTTSIVSGPGEIEENELLLFTGAGAVKLKIKANDKGGEELIVDINVTDKNAVLIADFMPFEELLDDGVPVQFSMSVYPEDAFTDWQYKIKERITEDVQMSIDKDKLTCTHAGAITLTALDRYTNTEYDITVVGFIHDQFVEKADTYARSLMPYNRERPLHIISYPEFGRRSNLDFYAEDESGVTYSKIRNTINVKNINDRPYMMNLYDESGIINYNGYISADYESQIIYPDGFEITQLTEETYLNDAIRYGIKYFKNNVEVNSNKVDCFVVPELHIDGVRQFQSDGTFYVTPIYREESDGYQRFIEAYEVSISMPPEDIVGKEIILSFIHVDSSMVVDIPLTLIDNRNKFDSLSLLLGGIGYIDLNSTERKVGIIANFRPSYQLIESDIDRITFITPNGSVEYTKFVSGSNTIIYPMYIPNDFEGMHEITMEFKVDENKTLTASTSRIAMKAKKITEIKINGITTEKLICGKTYDLTPTVVPADAYNANNISLRNIGELWEHVSGNNYKLKDNANSSSPSLVINYTIDDPNNYYVDYTFIRSGQYYVNDDYKDFYFPKVDYKNIFKDEGLYLSNGQVLPVDPNGYWFEYSDLVFEAVTNCTIENENKIVPVDLGEYEFTIHDKNNPSNKIHKKGNVVDYTKTLDIVLVPDNAYTFDKLIIKDIELGKLRLDHSYGEIIKAIPNNTRYHMVDIVSSDETIVSVVKDTQLGFYDLKALKLGTVTITATSSFTDHPDMIPMTKEFVFEVVPKDRTYESVWLFGHPVTMVDSVKYYCDIDSTPEGAWFPSIQFMNSKNINFTIQGNKVIAQARYSGLKADNSYYYEIWDSKQNKMISYNGGSVAPSGFESIKTFGMMETGDNKSLMLYGDPASEHEVITKIEADNDKLIISAYDQSIWTMFYSIDVSEKSKFINLTIETYNNIRSETKTYTTRVYTF